MIRETVIQKDKRLKKKKKRRKNSNSRGLSEQTTSVVQITSICRGATFMVDNTLMLKTWRKKKVGNNKKEEKRKNRKSAR